MRCAPFNPAPEITYSELRKAFPGFAFVGEETAAVEGSYKITDEPTFIVDPVDGTTNAVHRIPAVHSTLHAAARTGRHLLPCGAPFTFC